jgi:hypothetical protein
MPLQHPVLDDRDFEQLLAETRRRIPAHTPEWTNFNVESDPGITLVQLFAFLTDNLLYRANRIPERNRLKFLQLLGIPLQKAAAAEGVVTISNERGPVEALSLAPGVVVSAGSTHFLTRDSLTVLPLAGQLYYKRAVPDTDPRHEEYSHRYQAILAAMALNQAGDPDVDLLPAFYETVPMARPTNSTPNPVVDLATDTLDQALYLALLAPPNVPLDDVREAIAHKTLSLGVAPALDSDQPPLRPGQRGQERQPLPALVCEIGSLSAETPAAAYERLPLLQEPDLFSEAGILQTILPAADKLHTWEFPDPEQEGTGDFPPRLEDDEVRSRLITWLRLRLSTPAESVDAAGGLRARLRWVGLNATRIRQAVPISNELLGSGTGEPDQVVTLANTPVIDHSLRLEVQQADGGWRTWRLTDDLLAATVDEEVYTLDPESGQIQFGDGLRGARPSLGRRIRASYQYGGGRQGNVAIGTIKTSSDSRLQGGFKIENPLPTWGGDEGESTAEGERNIPRHLRHRDRAVTTQDFREIVHRTPGVDVGRVEVLPLFHPEQPAVAAAGVVTVMVIPRYDRLHPHWPTPDRLFLRQVCRHLEPRRLITTEIHVRGPVYLPVHLSVGVKIQEGHFRDTVLEAVRHQLQTYLSALRPGGPDGEAGHGWPLYHRLLARVLEAAVTRVSGVAYVRSLQMGIGDSLDVTERDLSGLELPRLASLHVREGEAEPLSELLGEADPGTPPGAPEPPVELAPIPVARSQC